MSQRNHTIMKHQSSSHYDPDQRHIIAPRLRVLCAFFNRYLATNLDPRHCTSADLINCYDAFIQFEHTINQSTDDDWIVRVHTRMQWQTLLTQLANDWQLLPAIDVLLIQECWQRGRFDTAIPYHPRHRPDLKGIIHAIRAFLTPSDAYPLNLSQLLYDQGLCRNLPIATVVERTLNQRYQTAAAQARGIAIAACVYGVRGLLLHSTYPYTNAVLMLEHKLHLMPANVYALFPHIWSAIRILIDVLNQFTTKQFQPSLWREHLLNDIRGGEHRQYYQKHLRPRLKANVITKLALQRQCSTDEAQALFECYYLYGLDGIIDWHCKQHGITFNSRQWTLDSILKHQLGGLEASHYKHIHAIIESLHIAIETFNVPISLVRLLDERPSSIYRRKFGRRIWFGTPAQARYRALRHRKPSSITNNKPVSNSIDDEVIEQFVTYLRHAWNLTETQVRGRINRLMTYGAVGLLPQKEWRSFLPPLLLDYIYSIKLGHLNGSVPWDRFITQIKHLANDFQYPIPSTYLIQVLFNYLPKPRRWNGGMSATMAGIRVQQRATTLIKGVKFLHDMWNVVSIKLSIALSTSVGHHLSDACWVVLIFDTATELPVGCWVSATFPREREVCLALYVAIWHPGTLGPHNSGWPIHGIPKTLQIDEQLVPDGHPNLTNSAEYLLMEIQTFKQPAKKRTALETTVAKHAPEALRRAHGQARMTPQQAQQTLYDWLRTVCFPNHRSASLNGPWKKKGFVAPGYDTPAAGWLLPMSGEVHWNSNEVNDDGIIYMASESINLASGTVKKRSFPYLYKGVDRGIFVELQATQHLLYLRRIVRKK